MSMIDDIGGQDGDRVLVAEYVLGLLDASEHAAVARRIASERPLAVEARLWRTRFAALDREFAETPAPASILPAIEARLFGAGVTTRRGFWDSLPFWRTLAAGALAVAVVAIGVNILRPAPIGPQEFATQLVAALEAEGSDVKYLALYDGATGTVKLTALSGEAVPEKDYELWYIHGEEAPVSMGVIPIAGRTQMALTPDAQIKFEDGTVLAITLEPKGGSPTGAPTGPIVAAGAATLI